MNSAGGRKPDPVVSQAIAWWVRLQSGVAGADELVDADVLDGCLCKAPVELDVQSAWAFDIDGASQGPGMAVDIIRSVESLAEAAFDVTRKSGT